ncbi:MAG: helicase HerA-like domain-containing protein [Ignavibacteria bacterium]
MFKDCSNDCKKKERKWGVGLLLVTQRPSELDETVLSQCGTMIALRMNNSKDRGHIRSAVQMNYKVWLICFQV